MNLCNHCGELLESGVRFCTGCGTSVPTQSKTESFGSANPVSQPYPPSQQTVQQSGTQGFDVTPLSSSHGSESGSTFFNPFTGQSSDSSKSHQSPAQADSTYTMADSASSYDDPLSGAGQSATPKPKRNPLLFIALGVAVLLLGTIAFLLFRTSTKLPIIQAIEFNKAVAHQGDIVTVTARTEGADEKNLNYQWVTSAGQIVGNGPIVTLDTAGIDASSGRAEVLISLIVTDEKGNKATSAQTITVIPSAITAASGTTVQSPLIVELQADQSAVRVGENVRLTADISNRPPNEVSYEWQTSEGSIQGNGQSVSLVTSGIQVSGNSRQISVTVTVKDSGGAYQADAKTINVVSAAPSNWPPTIRLRANNMSVQQGEEVEITADTKDKDGDNLTLTWSNSQGQLIGRGNRVKLATAPVNPGQIEVIATVTDGRGESATERLTLTVLPRPKPNRSPIIARIYADNARVRVGDRVTITAQASDPDEDSLIYSWGSSFGAIRGNGNTVTLDTSGIETSSGSTRIAVTVNVSDQRGGDARQQMSIVVVGEPPRNEPTSRESQSHEVVKPNRNPGQLSAAVESGGETSIVSVSGNPGTPRATNGSIAITVFNSSASVIGYFPDVPCSYLVGNKDNVDQISFAGTPGPGNGYSRMRVRVKPKKSDKPVSFTINWRTVLQ
jgi:hypothetical protein